MIPLLAVASSCSRPVAYFKPAAQVHIQQGGRPIVAVYDMKSSDGSPGATRLYSRGIFLAKGHTIAHVAMELESNGDAGLMVSVRSLHLTAKAGDRVAASRPVGTYGPTSIPARGFGRLDAFFELPEGTNPRSITSFEVSWEAALGDKRTDQTTPFVRTVLRGASASYYHGPFLPGTDIYSPWGAWFSCPNDPTYYTSPPDC